MKKVFGKFMPRGKNLTLPTRAAHKGKRFHLHLLRVLDDFDRKPDLAPF